jgi:hypothetical protein
MKKKVKNVIHSHQKMANDLDKKGSDLIEPDNSIKRKME